MRQALSRILRVQRSLAGRGFLEGYRGRRACRPVLRLRRAAEAVAEGAESRNLMVAVVAAFPCTECVRL
jgi:hypothetical protein